MGSILVACHTRTNKRSLRLQAVGRELRITRVHRIAPRSLVRWHAGHARFWIDGFIIGPGDDAEQMDELLHKMAWSGIASA